MTFPLLIAHKSRTTAILEGMNERIPGKPRDLSDMERDIVFRRSVANSQIALSLIATHSDEPASEIVALAFHAIEQCRGFSNDPDVDPSTLPAETSSEVLFRIYSQTLAILLEEANAARPPTIEKFDDILAHADVRKRYPGPLAALIIVARCEFLPSSTIARFAFDAAVDSKACPGGDTFPP